jgi:hypothetical protein
LVGHDVEEEEEGGDERRRKSGPANLELRSGANVKKVFRHFFSAII